ncbi:MAG TPA: hypothetical protein VFG07_00015 [Thermoplasmata archaeon]|nr:hypothetical protein [Thermoplasmata archaeon]
MPVQSSPASRPIPWSMLIFLSRILGFVLLFIGTILVVAGASIWGGCIVQTGASPCGAAWLSGVLNYIVVGKILWAIGLLGLGGGAGMKLHWSLQMPSTRSADELSFIARERWANYAVLLLSVLLMAVLLLTVNQWPPVPPVFP